LKFIVEVLDPCTIILFCFSLVVFICDPCLDERVKERVCKEGIGVGGRKCLLRSFAIIVLIKYKTRTHAHARKGLERKGLEWEGVKSMVTMVLASL
jgi:hypothetical protein